MISRATLPAEFFDITSNMLLVQPEPQYLHALLLKMAMSAALDVGPLALPGRPSVGESGAPYASADSGRLLLADPIYGGAVNFVAELGKGPGHTVRMNRPVFANTTYTQASREVPAGSTISTTPVDLTSEQVSITLKRFAGPYDSSNARVAPFGIDRFDASVSLHSLAKVVGLQLKRDFDRTLDQFGVALFDAVASANVIRPAGMTDDNSSAVAGDFPLDYDTITRVESALDTANIPRFPNGKRVMVLHPNQCAQLVNDPQFARYAEFHRDMNPLFSGSYWKSIGGFDIFKSTTLSTSTNTPAGVTIYKGQAFGPGMVGAGLGELPGVVPSTSDNYGEQALVIWRMYAGFATLDNRFGCSIRTS